MLRKMFPTVNLIIPGPLIKLLHVMHYQQGHCLLNEEIIQNLIKIKILREGETAPINHLYTH